MSDNRQSLADLAALTGATPPAPAPEPTTSEAATTDASEAEAPAAPVLLSIYGAHGLAGGRIELSPVAAVQLAADLLAWAAPKLASAVVTTNRDET